VSAQGVRLPPLFLPALLLLAGCEAPAIPAPCSLAFATDLPLRFSHNQVLTPAVLDGQTTSMVLDTGSQFTLVTKSTADRMNLDIVAASGEMTGIGGSRGVYIFSAKNFQIGRLQGKNLPLMVSDFVLAPGGRPVDGLLGADFLAPYDVDLDFPASKASLFKVQGSCPATATALDGPLFQAPLVPSDHPLDSRPFVRVEVAGKSLLAAVDSGAAHTLIFGNAARRIGLRVEDLAREPHFRARGIGPETPVIVRHVMAPITIGEITLRNLPVAIMDEGSPDSTDMLLGLDFLSHVHVWLSFSSHVMLMQYPPKPSPPPPK
jgi:predicted aspartyl protease